MTTNVSLTATKRSYSSFGAPRSSRQQMVSGHTCHGRPTRCVMLQATYVREGALSMASARFHMLFSMVLLTILISRAA